MKLISLQCCVEPIELHQFGSTVLPETLLEYVWHAEGEVWKGTLMAADLEQVDKNRRVRISRHIAQREEVISPILVAIPRTADGQFKIYWWRSGSENSNLDKVPSKFEEKFKRPFLENQTGFHRQPGQEVIAHQHGLCREQRYPHQKLLRTYLGKLVMNCFNKQTYAVFSRLNKLL